MVGATTRRTTKETHITRYTLTRTTHIHTLIHTQTRKKNTYNHIRKTKKEIDAEDAVETRSGKGLRGGTKRRASIVVFPRTPGSLELYEIQFDTVPWREREG